MLVAVSRSMNQTTLAPTGPTSGGQDNYQAGNSSSEISPLLLLHNCVCRQAIEGSVGVM